MVRELNEFNEAIVAAGLMSAEEIAGVWSGLDDEQRPRDAEAFATVLVKKSLLNDFQTRKLLSGERGPLTVGDYVLFDAIGRGGMGHVFKARHRVMDRVVAVKFLSPETAGDPESIQRFQREVRVAAKLTHPNIVQAHDASVQRGIWYLVMEFVDGADLAAVVKERGPLPVDTAADYITQAARGVAHAHAQGVVHRDLKPSNLLLDGFGIVKVLDMGLARIDQNDGSGDHQLTATGRPMGTFEYMAPEQGLNMKSADARSDIYSLGCSLYTLLSGTKIYGGTTYVEKIFEHLNQPIPKLTALRPDVPLELERIFTKMVAKRPDDRYQTAIELVAELEALRSSTPPLVASAPPTAQPQPAPLPLGQRNVESVANAGIETSIDKQAKAPVVVSPVSQAAASAGAAPQPGAGAGSGRGFGKMIGMGVGGVSVAALIALFTWSPDEPELPPKPFSGAPGPTSPSVLELHTQQQNVSQQNTPPSGAPEPASQLQNNVGSSPAFPRPTGNAAVFSPKPSYTGNSYETMNNTSPSQFNTPRPPKAAPTGAAGTGFPFPRR